MVSAMIIYIYIYIYIIFGYSEKTGKKLFYSIF